MLRKCSRSHGTVLVTLLSGLVLAPACLVTFDDYPLGDPNASTPASAGVGGTAGSNADGGAASGGEGAVGASAGAPNEPEPDEALIDDFEDGDAQILEVEGRRGTWRVSSAESMEPVPTDPVEPEALLPARGASASALHISGDGQSQWRGALRATFEPDPFDASGYTGVKFWARSADGAEHVGRAVLPIPGTASMCFPCGDHYGKEITYTPEWQEYVLPFDDVSQAGWGDLQVGFDPRELVGVQFSFDSGVSYDVWIDDVRFY